MPTEHIRVSYTYDELSDTAKAKAVEEVASRFAGQWWDENDNDDVRDVMRFAFGEKLKTPGWDIYGPGDFTTDAFKVAGFQVGYAPFVAFEGTLNRENAPGLPWHDHAENITLSAPHRTDATRVEVNRVDALPFVCTGCGQTASVSYGYDGTAYPVHERREGGLAYPDHDTDADHEAWLLEGLPSYTSALGELGEAVEKAVRAALEAGEKEYEYKTGEDYARDYIEHNDQEFNEDGSIF